MSLRPGELAELRRSSFKASVSAADGLRRRVSVMDSIRKASRRSALRKKRSSEAVPYAQSHPLALEKTLASLTQLAAGLYSDDINIQFEAARKFRKLVTIEQDPPVKEVIKCGVLPCLVQLLSREDYPQLQYEAAWTLSNIVSGSPEDTMAIVNIGVVDILVKLLASPNEDVRKQAVWTLANVAGDSAKCRDIVLANGALFPLLRLFNGSLGLPFLRTATWCLRNICHEEHNFGHLKPVFRVLRQLIYSEDEELLSDACWTMSYLSHGNDYNARIETVIETGVCPRLVELLSHPSPSVLIPSMIVVGSIAAGDDVHTQHIIDLRALPYLLNLLITNQNKKVKEKACWTISNITAGNKEHIQAVIDANIIAPLIHLMRTAEFSVSNEAAWAISNTCFDGTHGQIKYLVSQGCINAFCDILGRSDPRMLTFCLEGLKNILKVGEQEKDSGVCDVNMYAQMIEDADGLDKIEDLLDNDNNMVCQMASYLLETFWVEEDEDVMS